MREGSRSYKDHQKDGREWLYTTLSHKETFSHSSSYSRSFADLILMFILPVSVWDSETSPRLLGMYRPVTRKLLQFEE